MDAHRKRFYRDVTDHVRELMVEMGQPRLVISGDDQAAHQFKDQLPDDLKSKLAGIIARAILRVRHGSARRGDGHRAVNYEREKEETLVDEVINFAKSGGRGALGHADVVKALMEQRVETLILPYPPTDRDLANELKLKAFRAGTTIELVHGLPATKLESEGGVGARLYYAYETNESS